MSSEDLILYPVTIVTDRYTGTYSGGIYTAFNLYPYQLPKEIFYDDRTCDNMWSEIKGSHIPVGYGVTIKTAYMDLQDKVEDFGNLRLLDYIQEHFDTWAEIMEYMRRLYI